MCLNFLNMETVYFLYDKATCSLFLNTFNYQSKECEITCIARPTSEPLGMLGTGILSPIPKVDGEMGEENLAKYSFKSMYTEEDILYTIGDIFPKQK